MNRIIVLIVGLLSGVCASMGLGGGFVLMIYLMLFTTILHKQAQLMNLLFFIPIALLSVILHRSNHMLEKRVLGKAIVTGIIGVCIGAALSNIMDAAWLAKVFGGFTLLIGLRELFHKKSSRSNHSRDVRK